ncbi:hypothetical protein ACFQZ4_35020 [Catellatospora coxensis]|uniref:Uncharacterized protein n=1 Tax=Catellatospora coxensis TaxID=310354 RepID=A0A8J3P9V0_9ACTN|nr:hypothetical protein [Catellatospora coxensis]GIG09182.1 hypothetical protein Cco03nite_58820 [Catellatospora coxensis]
MADPRELVSWSLGESDLGRRHQRALRDAAGSAASWIEQWPGCVSATVARPIRFRFGVSVLGDDAPRQPTAELVDGVVEVSVTVDRHALAAPAPLLRRRLLDDFLAGIELAASIAPHQPPTEVWIEPEERTTGDLHPRDVLGAELSMLAEDEVMVIRPLREGADGLGQYHELDDALVARLNRLKLGDLLDTSSHPDAVRWTIRIRRSRQQAG